MFFAQRFCRDSIAFKGHTLDNQIMSGNEMRGLRARIRGAWCVLLLISFVTVERPAAAITAQLIAGGLTQPLFLTTAPGDATHIYVVEQTGQVLRFDLQTNTFDPAPFIDVSSRLTSTSGEQGLLGLAFDPDYATNGKFYLNFVVPGGKFGNGVTHVSQFTHSAGAMPTSTATSPPKKKKKKKHHPPPPPAGPGEVILLTFDHPQTNHNGGWIGFSPRANDDHNLYIATGDGGNAYDQGVGHAEPGGNAQNKTKLLGKMLRIHVDANTGAVTIPAGNRFATSKTARGEIFAYGLRNPFRNSFDPASGRLFIGDVGQDTREEVDVQQPSNPGGGENYGWRLREGFIQTPASVGGLAPAGNVNPILDYPHSVGECVIGGYVYHGGQVPQLVGKYVFGDFIAGKIFTLDYDGTTASNFTEITAQLFPTRNGGIPLGNPSSFGLDASGELYICDLSAGRLFKIVP
jgi:glucose/arabinose dehydrogenase